MSEPGLATPKRAFTNLWMQLYPNHIISDQTNSGRKHYASNGCLMNAIGATQHMCVTTDLSLAESDSSLYQINLMPHIPKKLATLTQRLHLLTSSRSNVNKQDWTSQIGHKCEPSPTSLWDQWFIHRWPHSANGRNRGWQNNPCLDSAAWISGSMNRHHHRSDDNINEGQKQEKQQSDWQRNNQRFESSHRLALMEASSNQHWNLPA